MKNLKIICSVVLIVATQIVFAQIGVGTSNPDASALLDVTSTSKGLLVPRISDNNLINNPALGLTIFNTTSNKLEINIGIAIPNWVKYSDVGPAGFQGLKGPTGLRGLPGITYSSSGAIGSVVGGGTTNVASGLYSTVIGGSTNLASGENAMVGGGTTNAASGTNATVAGGTTNWASGDNSFVGGGSTNLTSALNSNIAGGTTNQANGIGSSISGGTTNLVSVSGEKAAIGGGSTNNTVALYSNISGGNTNRTNGNSSAVSGGRRNFATSYGEWVGGLNGTNYSAASISIFAPTDRIFNVGNGELPASSSDAFTILKNGLATMPTIEISAIETANNKAIMTKEYTDANFSKINTNAPLSPGDFGTVGEIRVTTDYIYTCVATNIWVRTLVEAW
jgi:hypothetical protein